MKVAINLNTYYGALPPAQNSFVWVSGSDAPNRQIWRAWLPRYVELVTTLRPRVPFASGAYDAPLA